MDAMMRVLIAVATTDIERHLQGLLPEAIAIISKSKNQSRYNLWNVLERIEREGEDYPCLSGRYILLRTRHLL